MLYSDGGGAVKAARRPIYGRDKIARFITGDARDVAPDTQTRVVDVNGAPGVFMESDGRPYAVITAMIAAQ